MKKFKWIALAMCLITVLTIGLVACKKMVDPTPPVTETLPTVTEDMTLDEANKIIVNNKNYTLKMDYIKDNVPCTQDTVVSADAIVDTVIKTIDGTVYTEVTITEKSGDKYYESTRSTTAAVTTASADGEVFRTEVTKEYFDSKYDRIVNVYIPLTNSDNYEKKDDKYVIKEELLNDFAGRMNISVAEAKEINMSVTNGGMELNAPNVAGMKSLSLSITDVGKTTVVIPDEVKTAPVETMTVHNFYKWLDKGFEIAQYANDKLLAIAKINAKNDVLMEAGPDKYPKLQYVTIEDGLAVLYYQSVEGDPVYKETANIVMTEMIQMQIKSLSDVADLMYSTQYCVLRDGWYYFDTTKEAEWKLASRDYAKMMAAITGNSIDETIEQLYEGIQLQKFKFDDATKTFTHSVTATSEYPPYNETRTTVIKNVGNVPANLKPAGFENAILIEDNKPQPKPDPEPGQPENPDSELDINTLGEYLRNTNFTATITDGTYTEEITFSKGSHIIKSVDSGATNVYRYYGIDIQQDSTVYRYDYRYDKDNRLVIDGKIVVDQEYADYLYFEQLVIISILFDGAGQYYDLVDGVYSVPKHKQQAYLDALHKIDPVFQSIATVEEFRNLILDIKIDTNNNTIFARNQQFEIQFEKIGTTNLVFDQALIDSPIVDNTTPPEPDTRFDLNTLSDYLRNTSFIYEIKAKDLYSIITYDRGSFLIAQGNQFKGVDIQKDGKIYAYSYHYDRDNKQVIDYKQVITQAVANEVYYKELCFLSLLIDNAGKFYQYNGTKYVVPQDMQQDYIKMLQQSDPQYATLTPEQLQSMLLDINLDNNRIGARNADVSIVIHDIDSAKLVFDQALIDSPLVDNTTTPEPDTKFDINTLGEYLRNTNFTSTIKRSHVEGDTNDIIFSNGSCIVTLSNEQTPDGYRYIGIDLREDGTMYQYVYHYDQDKQLIIDSKQVVDHKHLDTIYSNFLGMIILLVDNAGIYFDYIDGTYSVPQHKLQAYLDALAKTSPLFEGVVGMEVFKNAILNIKIDIRNNAVHGYNKESDWYINNIGTTELVFEQALIDSPLVDPNPTPEQPKLLVAPTAKID